MATIAENLQKLITAKNNIIDALKDKGIEMPDNANLSSVSSLITSSSIAPQTVATDISKCGRLLTKFAVFQISILTLRTTQQIIKITEATKKQPLRLI